MSRFDADPEQVAVNQVAFGVEAGNNLDRQAEKHLSRVNRVVRFNFHRTIGARDEFAVTFDAFKQVTTAFDCVVTGGRTADAGSALSANAFFVIAACASVRYERLHAVAGTCFAVNPATGASE